jgi:hypothetical protein
LHRRQRVRSSDTRDAFVEPRPGSKKISRKLITRQIPSSPASSRPPPSPRVSISAHPASSTRHRLRAATFGFRSLHVELQLLADRQVVSGVVAESSRCRLGWQFYINKSTVHYTAHEAEPRGSGKPTPYHPATRQTIRCIHPIYYRSPSSSLRPIFRPVANRQFPITAPRCSSVSCTYPGIDVGGFKLRRLISCDQPNSGFR